MKNEKATTTAEDLSRRFDDGEDISGSLDWDRSRRPGLQQRRVSVDLPVWMMQKQDLQADLVGLTRQSTIKVWLSDRPKSEVGEQICQCCP